MYNIRGMLIGYIISIDYLVYLAVAVRSRLRSVSDRGRGPGGSVHVEWGGGATPYGGLRWAVGGRGDLVKHADAPLQAFARKHVGNPPEKNARAEAVASVDSWACSGAVGVVQVLVSAV